MTERTPWVVVVPLSSEAMYRYIPIGEITDISLAATNLNISLWRGMNTLEKLLDKI